MSLTRREYKTRWQREYYRANREKCRESSRLSKARRTEALGEEFMRRRAKNYNLQHKHKITLAQYERILADQGGCCAICGGASTGKLGFHVDHDHVTGNVRGILCGPCNQGLIAVDRTPGWTFKARAYVRRSQRS